MGGVGSGCELRFGKGITRGSGASVSAGSSGDSRSYADGLIIGYSRAAYSAAVTRFKINPGLLHRKPGAATC